MTQKCINVKIFMVCVGGGRNTHTHTRFHEVQISALQIQLFPQPPLTAHHLDTIFIERNVLTSQICRTDRVISDYI